MPKRTPFFATTTRADGPQPRFGRTMAPWFCPRVQYCSVLHRMGDIASLCQIIYNALAPIYVKGKVPGGRVPREIQISRDTIEFTFSCSGGHD